MITLSPTLAAGADETVPAANTGAASSAKGLPRAAGLACLACSIAALAAPWLALTLLRTDPAVGVADGFRLAPTGAGLATFGAGTPLAPMRAWPPAKTCLPADFGVGRAGSFVAGLVAGLATGLLADFFAGLGAGLGAGRLAVLGAALAAGFCPSLAAGLALAVDLGFCAGFDATAALPLDGGVDPALGAARSDARPTGALARVVVAAPPALAGTFWLLDFALTSVLLAELACPCICLAKPP